ncbi:MAG: hypothetical protein JWL70_2653 [Acidimicrobiia bacterium]|nr:hypothetical protein [Acidimicrobiia bacterium]
MPTEGDISVRDGKLMEYRDGEWVVVRASQGPLPMRVEYDEERPD